MKPPTRTARMLPGPRWPWLDCKQPGASQALPEPMQDALGDGQDDLVVVLADYYEPHHCDPPREDPTEPLLRILQREVLLGTW